MLLARNLAANAGNQIWSLLLNILVLPVYLGLVGAEAYALVGFGLTIQFWATLLDAGMSPTLSRDMARFRAGELPERDLLSFLRSLDWLCIGIVASACVAGFLTREWWAESWFRDHGLKVAIIDDSMAMIIAFSVVRWASGLYRSAIMGLERQVFANAISAVANTLRLIGPIPLLWHSNDVRLLFAWWLVVAALELAVFRWACAASFSIRLPLLHFSGAVLKGRAKLAGSIAFLSLVWILVTQSDKLILSRVLSLSAYGYFTIAIVLSNAFLLLSTPITQAFQPQMTIAASKLERPRLAHLVHSAAQVMALTLIVPALTIAAFPLRLVFGWTGDAQAATAVAPYLGYYVLGSALVGPVSLAYAIQLAHGNLRLHVIANIVFAAVLIPAVWLVAGRYGALGAAVLWIGLNFALVVFYGPLVLERFVPGEALRWLAYLWLPALAAALVLLGGRALFGDELSVARYANMLVPCLTGGIAFVFAAAVTPIGRAMARRGLAFSPIRPQAQRNRER